MSRVTNAGGQGSSPPLRVSLRFLLLLVAAGVLWCTILQARSVQEEQARFGVRRNTKTEDPSLEPTASAADGPPDLPAWLHRYSEFHADQLRNHPDTASYLVWSCGKDVLGATPETRGCGGIGDRLRGIVTSLYLAVATDRVLLIHNPSPVDLGIVFKGAMIDWDARSWNAHGDESLPLVFESLNVPSPGLFSDFAGHRVVNVVTNLPLWAEVLSHKGFEKSLRAKGVPFDEWELPRGEILFAWGWRVLFEPTAELEAVIDAQRARAGLSPSGRYVAVHVRHGGHWGDPVRHGPDQLGRFANCTRRVASALSQNGDGDDDAPPSVFVASDDVGSKAGFRELVPEALADDVEPYHVDRTRVNGRTRGIPDARMQNLETWAEFLILSRADCVVFSRSGFSECAVALSRHPVTGARCAAQFDDCGSAKIESSMSSLVPIDQWSQMQKTTRWALLAHENK